MILDIGAAKAKAFDPFDPKSAESSTKVPLLAIRRPGDPPPTPGRRLTLFTLLRAVCGRADHALQWWCGLRPCGA
jgi:hypothetical protein